MKKIILLLAFSFQLSASPVFAQAASLSLEPSSGTFNQGCNFSLKVNLDTGGAQTYGTDALLLYDASKFNATTITDGTVYPDFPGNVIDAQNGKIAVLGLASPNASFSGKGTLATLNFTVKETAPTGATQITFDFSPTNKAKTDDSNVAVIQGGAVVDVLNSVVNGNYTIGTGACGIQVASPLPRGAVGTPSASLKPTPLPTKETLPPAGTEQFTYTIAIVGGILAVLGILGLALL